MNYLIITGIYASFWKQLRKYNRYQLLWIALFKQLIIGVLLQLRLILRWIYIPKDMPVYSTYKVLIEVRYAVLGCI